MLPVNVIEVLPVSVIEVLPVSVIKNSVTSQYDRSATSQCDRSATSQCIENSVNSQCLECIPKTGRVYQFSCVQSMCVLLILLITFSLSEHKVQVWG